MVAVQQGSLVATVWLDTKPVTVMATNCQAGETCTVKRKTTDGSKTDVRCPTTITAYTQCMHGVDYNDQMRQYYAVPTKCRKYYKYIFWFLFELASTNSYILMKQFTPTTMTLRDFRESLAKTLIGSYNSRKRPGRIPLQPRQTTENHFPKKFKREGKVKAARCVRCLEDSIRKETTWFCYECNVHLCHTGEDDTDCFQIYHAK
jgi:hypothetical protein